MKLNKKSKIKKKIVRVIDKMIPEEQYKILPKATKLLMCKNLLTLFLKIKV